VDGEDDGTGRKSHPERQIHTKSITYYDRSNERSKRPTVRRDRKMLAVKIKRD
jgi:hypothetical protein